LLEDRRVEVPDRGTDAHDFGEECFHVLTKPAGGMVVKGSPQTQPPLGHKRVKMLPRSV
jgi:hypothetical protein